MGKKILLISFLLVFFLSAAVFAGAADFGRIEAPENLTAEKKTDDEGNPVILLRFDAPDTVKQLGEKGWGAGTDLCYEVECKIGRGVWEPVGSVPFSEGEQIVITDSEKAMNTDTNLYSFRVRFGYYDTDGSADPVYSLYSNIVSIGAKTILGTYKNASSWAVQELDKALQYGLITDKIRNEMNAPITREEICEVIMALYGNMAGEISGNDSEGFTDTKNPEVYKAYGLGIVTGVGDNRFDPDAATNREQVATMIFRAIKALLPDTDLSASGTESFSDEREISSWALEPVKFMNKNGLLKGSNGKVNPKGITTREQAVLIAVRAYERFALRFDSIDADGNSGADDSIPGKSSKDLQPVIIGKWSTHDNIGDIVDYNTGSFIRSEYIIIGMTFNTDGTFLRIFITSTGMSRYTGSYKLLGESTEGEGESKILLYHQEYEFFEPNASVPKESGHHEDEEYELRYDAEEDTLTIDFIGYNTLKRLK